jgi:hypothetical protein
MSNETTKTRSQTGDFINETAVRGVFGRRRRTPRRGDIEGTNGRSADPTIADRAATRTAGGPAPLRRWSVAELIARAAAAPPRTA